LGSPTVLYCGADDCLRIPVLRVAGFHVAGCPSVTELARHLDDDPAIAMVLFEEARGHSADAAQALVRQRSTAALVLFRHPAGGSSERNFDLVIDPATPPSFWLQRVSEVLLSRAGFSGAPAAWTQVARSLEARRRNGLPDEGSVRTRGYRIQPEKRRCT